MTKTTSNENRQLIETLLQIYAVSTQLRMMYDKTESDNVDSQKLPMEAAAFRRAEQSVKEKYAKLAKVALRIAQLTDIGISEEQIVQILVGKKLISQDIAQKASVDLTE